MSLNVPMTNPEGMLAMHEQMYGHTVSFVELADGRILESGGNEFRISEDRGLTWSEPFNAKDENGSEVVGWALVKLAGKAIGFVSTQMKLPPPRFECGLLFRRSEDDGRTWSAPVRVNPPGYSAYVWQDFMCRTSSGRIILPAYTNIGQAREPNWRPNHTFYSLGWVNGNVVSSSAHFNDPHFGGSLVFYSDDDGQTWQRNRDGELLIVLDDARRIEPACEPSVTEVTPGKLLMIMRTRLGRHFQAWSNDNGETWTRPQPTHLAGTQVPAQVRRLPDTGHLLCVFTQHSEDEIRRGYIRARLSSAISRNGGKVWEHFQNVESILEETHVEPGPIRVVQPEGNYPLQEWAAFENDPDYVVPLPAGYGRWSYPSVLVLKDRVLISHTWSWHDETGTLQRHGWNRLKVLPTRWFYGGREPYDNPMLKKLEGQAPLP